MFPKYFIKQVVPNKVNSFKKESELSMGIWPNISSFYYINQHLVLQESKNQWCVTISNDMVAIFVSQTNMNYKSEVNYGACVTFNCI